MTYDVIIIGGGIVGISTAWQLQQRYPDKKVLLLEKERDLAQHQTGHNSGVIHSGIYYQPGSLKADLCKRGVEETIRFCKEHRIPYEQCGKLLVATDELELTRMHALYTRCRDNEVDASVLDQSQLHEIEPNIAGISAIKVNATGIVDYGEVSRKMARVFVSAGGECRLGHEVRQLQESDLGVTVETKQGSFSAKFLIVCAGLMADRMALLHGLKTDFRIIPFRGEYYCLAEDKRDIIKHLIYPVPDPALPFLGVHLTRMIDGSVTVGPNAVLGWKREGYGQLNISMKDIADMAGFPGFWRVLKNNLRSGLVELRNSLWKQGYLHLVQKYCPQLSLDDLLPHPAGVRAQAVLKDGTLVHDFLFSESERSLHVCNAPSPAATSAIPIGAYICDKVRDRLKN